MEVDILEIILINFIYIYINCSNLEGCIHRRENIDHVIDHSPRKLRIKNEICGFIELNADLFVISFFLSMKH